MSFASPSIRSRSGKTRFRGGQRRHGHDPSLSCARHTVSLAVAGDGGRDTRQATGVRLPRRGPGASRDAARRSRGAPRAGRRFASPPRRIVRPPSSRPRLRPRPRLGLRFRPRRPSSQARREEPAQEGRDRAERRREEPEERPAGPRRLGGSAHVLPRLALALAFAFAFALRALHRKLEFGLIRCL